MHKTLNLHNWISELPEEIRDEVVKHFTTRKLTDGESLWHQGDKPTTCFQVTKGRLKVCNITLPGQEMVLTHLMEGDCTGDWGLIIDQPRMNSCFACGDAEVNILKKAHFNKLYEQYPEIAKALNRVMARRLRWLWMLTEDASFLTLRQRLARAIVRMGYSLGHVDENGCTTIEDISHDELAKMVGAARQSVGRELKKLEQENSIQIKYGKLIITDIIAFGEQYDNLLAVEPIVGIRGYD